MVMSPENKSIEIEQETLKHLNTSRKWAMFSAIIGFIFLGLIVILGLIAGTFVSLFKSSGGLTGLPQIIVFVFIIAMVVVYFFSIHFLFRFSKHTSNAIQTLNKKELQIAFKNLKSYFVYLGVLIIISLSFYIVALVIAGTSLSFFNGM